MTKKDTEKALEIINEYKSRPNKDLKFVLDLINEDFELTKNTLVKLSEHLDKLETTYNVILKEYQNRTNVTKR
jgi:hypothetical protein